MSDRNIVTSDCFRPHLAPLVDQDVITHSGRFPNSAQVGSGLNGRWITMVAVQTLLLKALLA
jgi:hypothetical protein